MAKLALSQTDKKLAGVCGGIAESLNISTGFVRLAFVAAALLGFGSSIIVYIILALVLN